MRSERAQRALMGLVGLGVVAVLGCTPGVTGSKRQQTAPPANQGKTIVVVIGRPAISGMGMGGIPGMNEFTMESVAEDLQARGFTVYEKPAAGKPVLTVSAEVTLGQRQVVTVTLLAKIAHKSGAAWFARATSSVGAPEPSGPAYAASEQPPVEATHKAIVQAAGELAGRVVQHLAGSPPR